VFKKVGVAAVQNAIDGFNSTIFAYGQTGTKYVLSLEGVKFIVLLFRIWKNVYFNWRTRKIYRQRNNSSFY